MIHFSVNLCFFYSVGVVKIQINVNVENIYELTYFKIIGI